MRFGQPELFDPKLMQLIFDSGQPPELALLTARNFRKYFYTKLPFSSHARPKCTFASDWQNMPELFAVFSRISRGNTSIRIRECACASQACVLTFSIAPTCCITWFGDNSDVPTPPIGQATAIPYQGPATFGAVQTATPSVETSIMGPQELAGPETQTSKSACDTTIPTHLNSASAHPVCDIKAASETSNIKAASETSAVFEFFYFFGRPFLSNLVFASL